MALAQLSHLIALLAALSLLATLSALALTPLVLPLLPDSASEAAFALVETIGQLSIWFVLVNLLPIPCLTGGHILTAVKPMWRDRFRRSQPYAALLLTLLAALGVVTGALEPAYRALAGSVLGE